MAASKKSKRRRKTDKSARGGARPGAGRKPKRGASRTVPLTVWVSKEDRELLGGLADSVKESPALYAYDLLQPALRKAAKKAARKKPRKNDPLR